MRAKQIVQVDWVDSCTSPGWRDNDLGVSHIQSVGFLVRRDKKEIVLTTSINDGDRYVDPMAIPMCAVKKVRRLK